MKGVTIWWGVGLLGLIACNLTLPRAEWPPPALPQTLIEMPTPSPTPDPLDGLEDAHAVMAGMCFEAAYQRRDTPFVFRSEPELIRFYDELDATQACAFPIERGTFDFSGGRVLVGLWRYGVGCTASHALVQRRDPATRTLTLQTTLRVEGDCNYELLRPLWVALALEDGWQVKVE